VHNLALVLKANKPNWKIKHCKWIWENNAMFPNYNDNVFQTTLNSLNESTTITIYHPNQEVKLKKDGAKENKIRNQKLISTIEN
jgi:hypothetical protein